MKRNLFCFILFLLTSNFVYPSALNYDGDVKVIEADETVKTNIIKVKQTDFEEQEEKEEEDYDIQVKFPKDYLTKTEVPLSIPTQLPENPCILSPCNTWHFWHWCQEFNGNARCICLPDSVRYPPKCIPECTWDYECNAFMKCIQHRCTDPCPGHCGNNMHCNVVNHQPHCSCLPGFTGQPWNSCYSMLQAPPKPTPCSPSPCGRHSQCREVDSQAVCRCKISSKGTPPKCRPECIINSECASDKACFNRKCVDPCVYKCAGNANCTVIAHNPTCSCQDGFTGDPFTNCVPIPLSIPTHQTEVNPCVSSPCGPNSRCQEVNGNARCTCLPNNIRSPPRCRPECTIDSECDGDEACINSWCSDPCPRACGNYADCVVKNHVPYCTCLPDSCQALDQIFGFPQYPVRGHKFGFPKEESTWPYEIREYSPYIFGSPGSALGGPNCPSSSEKLNGICVEVH